MNTEDKDMQNESTAYFKNLEKIQRQNQENIQARKEWQNAKGPKPPESMMQKEKPILSEQQMHEKAIEQARAGRIADEKNRKMESQPDRSRSDAPQQKSEQSREQAKAELKKQMQQKREQARGRRIDR